MGLRLVDGVDVARLEAVAGQPADRVLDLDALDRLIADGLLGLRAGRLATTAAGRQRLNALLAAILREPASACAGLPRSRPALRAFVQSRILPAVRRTGPAFLEPHLSDGRYPSARERLCGTMFVIVHLPVLVWSRRRGRPCKP